MNTTTQAATVVKEHQAAGSVWGTGDAVWGCEKNGDFSGLLCVQGRQMTARGRVLAPARMVSIVGPTWDSVCDAVVELGFDPPTLSEDEVRRPRRRSA